MKVVLLSLFAVLLAVPCAAQTPTISTHTDEVLLDFIVRDKKGKPVTDLAPGDVTVTDNGAAQKLASFRLVQGAEALAAAGSPSKLSPLRQLRLVTLAFEPMGEPDQRRIARTAAVNLVRSEQNPNTYYSVVMINTRLIALHPFTNDRKAVADAIEQATSGLSVNKLVSESEAIKGQLKTSLGAVGQDAATLAAAFGSASSAGGRGSDNAGILLSRVMLDMLRMDAAMGTDSARLSIASMQSLVGGLQSIPGRKSVLYFTLGLLVRPELDVPFRSLVSQANRANVTFYSIDSRGVTTSRQNAAALDQLRDAARASNTTTGLPSSSDGENQFSVSKTNEGRRTEGAVTKEEIMAADTAETSSRANLQLPVRDLAESTGGFLIGDTNDLRGPLKQVQEEIGSYYEASYNPGLKQYDGSFRKIRVEVNRKDLVVHARNGYFALPPEARAAGLAPFEVPLLKAIADGVKSKDIDFAAGAILLQPKELATDVALMVEVPLRALQANSQNVHVSLACLVKDSAGNVVQKITRDRTLRVTPEQMKGGNFTEKSIVPLTPGTYSVESAVMDHEGGKIGTGRSSLTVAAKRKSVEISSLTGVRSYVPNAKGLDPAEAFQFQGGVITPTLNFAVPRTQDSMLRLFFTVYQEASIPAKPAVEIEFLQGGKSLQKVPMQLPDADAMGRIPFVLTIPAAAIPPGSYEVRATAKQGASEAQAQTTVRIEQ